MTTTDIWTYRESGALGVDTFVGDNFVLGVEGTFLWSTAENETVDGPGVAFRKSFQEWAGAVRTPTFIEDARQFTDEPPPVADVPVLTDDYAPVDTMAF